MPIVQAETILRTTWERISMLSRHEQILAWLNLFQNPEATFTSIQSATPGKMQGIILVDWQSDPPDSYLHADLDSDLRRFSTNTMDEYAKFYKALKNIVEARQEYRKTYPNCGLAFWKHPNTRSSSQLEYFLRRKENEIVKATVT